MYTDEIKYGEIESGTFGIKVGTEIHSVLPEKRKCVQEILGIDGVVDFGIGGYGVRVITLPVYYDGDYALLRENREKIIMWLYDDGKPKKLILGTQPDRYYMAKVYAALDFENTSDRHIGDIQFECNPPWQYLSDGTLLTPEQMIYINCDIENGQFIKEFSANGSMRFYNKGTQAVRPVIKLIGCNNDGFMLTYGDLRFRLDTKVGYDGILIDCKNETVTRMSDGSNLYEYIDNSYNDFFELLPGECEIGFFDANAGEYPDSVTMIVQFDAVMNG